MRWNCHCNWTAYIQHVEPASQVKFQKYIICIFDNNKTISIVYFFVSVYRVISSSHPICNTIMLVGVIACFLSVFLLGVDGRFVNPSEYSSICQARSWVLTLGFTLAFGAMFSKVWRVHRLTTKTKADQAKVYNIYYM